METAVENRIAAAIASLPRELHKPVERWFDRLADQHKIDELPLNQLEPLVRVVACSEFAGATVLREWRWLIENIASFATSGRDASGSLAALAAADVAVDDVKLQLRRDRHRRMLRILWREVCDLADLDETLSDLSDLAEAALDVATRCAERILEPRYGSARDASGQRVPLVILGMGKLGGRELNFSSDIDLIFLFSEEGETDGARSVSAEEYFGRLSRRVISLVDEITANGFVFRIDTRLRPFGDSGPPVVSFAALESYLLHHGRDWERYAYVKARIVGPQPDTDIAEDLYGNLIQPFVYRRYLDYGIFESLREMHAKIAAEVQRRDLQDNVKLGPGGIREAEFIVQSLQLVRGGSEPALQGRGLQQVLPRLVNDRGLSAESAEDILKAYRYLRRLENFIQAMQDRQTHDLPEDPTGRARLCVAMGYSSWDSLLADLDKHRSAIANRFDEVAFRDRNDDTPFRQRVARAWEAGASESQWLELLEDNGASDPSEFVGQLVAFANAPVAQQIDSVARERLQRFIPELLVEVMQAKRPSLALQRTLAVLERILRRSAYISLLNENKTVLTRLVDLCARSRYIADQIARHPVLLDELLDPRIFSGLVTKDDLCSELQLRLSTVDVADSEARMHAIVQFQRATMFRIAVADFNGSLPIMKVSDGLTWLAETVLDAALEVTWHDMTSRHGVPSFVVNGARHEAGFGIVGYGKLGGLELSYGSDLDIIFLHDSRGESCVTNGNKPLDNTMFFARLVRRLVLFMTTQTGSGELYEIDTRLRPDGRSGLLVTSTEAFERYQEDNAWTWEHQALLRARPVAGSANVAEAFARIRKDTLINRVKRDSLRDDVISMRQRMRRELDRSSATHFDLKHGAGGIGDIEFLVQYLVLHNAAAYPDVVYFSDNIRQLDALSDAACIESEVSDRLQDCYRSYRVRQHHLVLDDQEPLIGTDEFEEQRRFVTLIWERWLD